MNFGNRNKRGKIGREKESLSQLRDFIIVGGSAKSRIIIPVVFLALVCLSTTALGVGSISGRVFKHSDNSILPGVWVQLYQGVDENIADQHAWEWVDNTQTDSNGDYQFTGLAQRRYRINIYSQDPGNTGTHYVETDIYNVQVFDGSDTGGNNLKLRQAGLIWGFVKTTGGMPIENAWVVSDASWGENFFGWHNTRTDSTGRYELWLFPSPGKFYPVWIRNAIIPGTTYKVYGGDTYISDGVDGYHPENHGYTLLGTGTTTKTFNDPSTYNYYIIVTYDGNVAKVDAVQGSDDSYYGTWNTGNTSDWGNVAGDPDGQFASVGQGRGYQGGFIFIDPIPGNSSLKVYIVDDSRGADPVSYESKWQDGYLFKATLSGTQVDYTLELGGMATGRVLNESGDPIKDVRVEGWNKYLERGDEAYTDSDGYFKVGGLTIGDNYVYLCNCWREIEQGGVKYMVGEAYRGPINITTAGQTEDVGTFTIYKAGMITGDVTDENGVPVVAAEVRVEGKDINGDWSEREDVVTDAFGQFTLDYVAPGKYVFYCEKVGFITTIIPGIIVNRDEQTDLDVVLNSQAKGATISGIITNYSEIAPKDSDGMYFPCYEDNDYEDYGFPEFGLIAISMDKTYTDEDFLDIEEFFVGDIEQEDIEDGYGDYFEPNSSETPGNYTMPLTPGDVTIGMYVFYNPETLPGWGGNAILHDWKRDTFTEGDSQTNVNFTAGTGNTGEIRGDIIVPSGYDYFPEDWCVIYAYALDNNNNIITAAPAGDAVAFASWTTKYEFRNMPVGNYKLRAYAQNLPSVLDMPPVTVNSGQTTTQDINFTGVSSGSLTGQVTSGGSPVEGATVTIVENGRQAITENDGSYTISAINTGTYTVKVTASGYADKEVIVTVGTGSNPPLNFSLDSQVGSISGTVKDDGGGNINGAPVVAYNESDYTHKTAQTVGGEFTITGLTPGQYILAVDAGIYGVVVHPDDGSRITLAANENKTGINIIVGTPEPPLFTVTSSVSHNGGTVLSMEFYSDQGLKAVPLVTKVEGAGSLGGLTPNSALNRFNIDYTADPGDTLVKIKIEETDALVSGRPASKEFSFEVSTDLVTTSSTNVTNATGGTASIMGTQDNTKIYVPPFAIAGAEGDTQALALTIERYGDPGQTVPGTPGSTASAVYDFEFDKEGVTIDTNHTFTVTMSFQLPSGMTEAEFENSLEMRYFDAGDQEWKTDGISNVRINWLNYTIMFEVSHLSKFAAFVPGEGLIGDFCGPPGSVEPDGYVDYWDLLYFAQRWHTRLGDPDWDPRCDLDKEDNYVDYWDLLVFAQQWHEGQQPQ